MKKLVILLLSILLALGLFACGNQPQPTTTDSTEATTTAATEAAETEETTMAPEETVETTGLPEAFVFPAGISVWGVNMEGKTAEEGYAALSSKLKSYSLQFTVNDKSFRISGSSMGLNYPENSFMATAEAIAAGEDASFDSSLRYSESALRRALSAKTDLEPVNATVSYSKAKQAFVVSPDTDGYSTDLTEALKLAGKIIPKLGSDKVSVTAEVTETVAEITADDPAFSSAVKKANSMISVSLSYTYAPEGEQPQTEVLTRDTLAGFLEFDQKNMSISFSTSALTKYTKKMDDKYQKGGSRGKFRTTGGGTVNLMVDYIGQGINTEELSRDIHSCMENGISGTREAPYLDAATCTTMPYNGTYIEVNLSAQRVWFYKSGELIVSSPIVSGCVSKGWRTPTGVYAIYSKFTNAWISSGTAYVHCFMAYNGNYGLHDATWRDEFGGDIYLTNGSHGCTNMPKEAALTLYNNCSIGTKVIIYGGATSVNMITQEISGTDTYRIPSDADPFMLDAAAVHGTEPLTYVSSDPNVVSVDMDGRVQVKGIGSATITVSCAENGYYTAAEKVITVDVYSACEDDRHIYGEWVETTPATCVDGEETFNCTCGKVLTRPIFANGDHTADSSWTYTTQPTCTTPGEKTGICAVCQQQATLSVDALDHDFTSGGENCDRGCGAANPNYTPPADPSDPDDTQPDNTEPDNSEQDNTEPSQPEGDNSSTEDTQPETGDPLAQV